MPGMSKMPTIAKSKKAKGRPKKAVKAKGGRAKGKNPFAGAMSKYTK